jgi:hypothetical protein
MVAIRIGFALMFLAGYAVAEEPRLTAKLICTTDQVTGFYFENGKWVRSHFQVSSKPYVVRPANASESRNGRFAYIVVETGTQRPKYYCITNHISRRLTCGNSNSGMIVDFESLRFNEYYTHGFIDGRDSNDDTPSISIGYCAKVE